MTLRGKDDKVDERKCDGCAEDRASFQRMKGGNKARSLIISGIFLFILGGGLYSGKAESDQNERLIALETTVNQIAKGQEERKEWEKEHDRRARENQRSTEEILEKQEAILRAIESRG